MTLADIIRQAALCELAIAELQGQIETSVQYAHDHPQWDNAIHHDIQNLTRDIQYLSWVLNENRRKLIREGAKAA